MKPEWYDESPASPSLSPASKKRQHDESEKELDEIKTDIVSGQEGMTMSELDAIIAECQPVPLEIEFALHSRLSRAI